MSTVLALAAVSALAGLGLGLYGLRWGALALSGVIIAIAAAVVLQHENFGFSAGVAITFGYLGLNQIAYVIGIAFRLGVSEADLTGDEPDEHPGDNRQEKVEDEHKQHDRTPPWGHPPNH